MTNSAGWSAPGAEPPLRPPQGFDSGADANQSAAGGGSPAGTWGSPPPGPGWGPPPGWTPSPTPGGIPLRPLALGEILDGAFTVVRRHAKVTLAWSAIIVLTGQLITLALGLLDGSLGAALNATGANPLRGGALPSRGLALVVSAATGGVLTGVMSIIVTEAVLGRRPEFAEVWARTRPRLLPLFGVAIAAGLLPYLGLIFLIVPGIYLWVALGLAPSALMVERIPVGAALRRSRQLVRGDWWRLFGIRAAAVLLGAAVGAVLALPVGLLGGLAAVGTSEDTSLPIAALVMVALVGAVASVLTQPFIAAVVALLYVDRRMRAEGLDVTLAQAVGAPVAGVPGQAPGGTPGAAGW